MEILKAVGYLVLGFIVLFGLIIGMFTAIDVYCDWWFVHREERTTKKGKEKQR